jgi:hypothetical protein
LLIKSPAKRGFFVSGAVFQVDAVNIAHN